ncbi:MAG: J domain-containing protein [Bacteroidetes bacterium]|nr:J domain-containing protein [Bacteroidota bacterium]
MTEYGTYYQLLGISPRASAEEIDTAFRLQADAHNPSLHPGEAQEHRFQAILDAYTVLRNPEARAQYDAHLASLGALESPNPLKIAFRRKSNPPKTAQKPKSVETPSGDPPKTFTQLLDFDWDALDEPTPEQQKEGNREFRMELIFKLLIILAFIGILSIIWLFL